jgi:hypothetical protein
MLRHLGKVFVAWSIKLKMYSRTTIVEFRFARKVWWGVGPLTEKKRAWPSVHRPSNEQIVVALPVALLQCHTNMSILKFSSLSKAFIVEFLSILSSIHLSHLFDSAGRLAMSPQQQVDRGIPSHAVTNSSRISSLNCPESCQKASSRPKNTPRCK